MESGCGAEQLLQHIIIGTSILMETYSSGAEQDVSYRNASVETKLRGSPSVIFSKCFTGGARQTMEGFRSRINNKKEL